MWYCDLNRREFLDYIGGKNDLKLMKLNKKDSLKANSELILIWNTPTIEKGSLPVAIVLNQSDITDFLAWSSTYLNGYLPLTAFTKILSFEEFEILRNINPSPSLGKLKYAWVGAIMGEAMEDYLTDSTSNKIPLRVCKNTYLYLVGRSLSLGMDYKTCEEVGEKYYFVRSLNKSKQEYTKQMDAKVKIRKEAFNVLYALQTNNQKGQLFDLSPGMQEVCKSFMNGSFDMRPIKNDIPKHEYLLLSSLSVGTREERVLIFEEFSQSVISINEIKSTYLSFIFGLALSLMSPGSFEYWRLSLNLATKIPGILTWYGIFAGLYPKSQMLRFENATGRKVLRDLTYYEMPLQASLCDISFNELQVLLSPKQKNAEFNISTPGQILIELAPTVNILIKWEEIVEKEKKKTKNNKYERNGLIRDKQVNVQKELFKQSTENQLKRIEEIEKMVSDLKSQLKE